jgi:methionine-rich copper-binding protein CopC
MSGTERGPFGGPSFARCAPRRPMPRRARDRPSGGWDPRPTAPWNDEGVKTRLRFVVLLGFAGLLGWAAPAAAHAVLVSSSPEPGAMVTSPAAISLTFDDALLEIGARIAVLDARGGDHAAGDAYFPEPTTIRVDVQLLDPGEYTAEWRVVADDGHPIEGTLPFTVVAAASEPPPSGQGEVVSSRPSPTGQDAAAVSEATAAEPQGQLYVTITVTLALIALVAVVVFFSLPRDSATGSRRRRKPRNRG